jgi:hypothetical protein
MSYTGQEIFEQAVVIIDELSDTGTVNDSQVKEYKYKAPRLLDMWQHEIIKHGDRYKTFEISCFRKRNLLGDLNQYGIIIENNGETQSYSASGVNCFYVEVDGDCTITITEDGTPVSGTYIFNNGEATAFTGDIAITVPAGTTSFLPCKGIITTSGGNVTMTLSGDYYFRHSNRALSPYKYATAAKVPDFKPWYKVEMPSDFKNRSQVVNEYPNWQYEEDSFRKWENNNELYVNFAYEGIIRVNYIPVPVKITSLTQTLEVDEITAISGAYYLAEHFAMADQNDELAARCRQKYAELKAESAQKSALSPQQIVDVYSIGSR